MRLFISYSTGDLAIVNQIADALRPHADVFFWDKDKEPGKVAWQTIFGWIDTADLVLAVITDQTVKRGISVGQEIGRAVTKGKLVVPLVSADVPVSELGCLSGITYQPISRHNLGEIVPVVAGKLQKIKQEREQSNRTLLTVLGAIGLIALLSGQGDNDDYY